MENMPISARLRATAQSFEGQDDTVPFGHILDVHGNQALGAILVIVSIPALLPSTGIPIGTVMSLGMFAIAIAMFFGRQEVRLPQKLMDMKLAPTTAQKFLNGLAKLYGRIERISKPRMNFMVSETAQRWLSLKVFLLAVIIFMPIPFGNTLPAAALLTLGIGLMFRDGAIVVASFAVTLVALATTAAIVGGGLWAIGQVV
jgi:hypothetical protein